MAVLLQLSLCVVIAIQLTSSQSTYDVIPRDNDVNNCEASEQVLSQLVRAVSQMQVTVSQMQVTVSQINMTVSQMQMTVSQNQVTLTQLQRDVAELKSFNQQKGMHKT